jgi:hypothetical protein
MVLTSDMVSPQTDRTNGTSTGHLHQYRRRIGHA